MRYPILNTEICGLIVSLGSCYGRYEVFIQVHTYTFGSSAHLGWGMRAWGNGGMGGNVGGGI